MTSFGIRSIGSDRKNKKPTCHFNSGGGLKKLEAGGILNAQPRRARSQTHATDAQRGVLLAKLHTFMLHGRASLDKSTPLAVKRLHFKYTPGCPMSPKATTEQKALGHRGPRSGPGLAKARKRERASPMCRVVNGLDAIFYSNHHERPGIENKWRQCLSFPACPATLDPPKPSIQEIQNSKHGERSSLCANSCSSWACSLLPACLH